MKAVILAGGKGTRLHPITDNIAKPFLKVAGKSSMEYLVDGLARDGFGDILMTMYYKPQTLISYFGSGFKWRVNMVYSIEDTPLGTFGGVKKNRGLLDETFIVANGDVLIDIDFKAIFDFHKQKKAVATIALTPVDNPTEFGIVGTDPDGRITRFKEKPAPEEVFSNLINAGVYVLEPEVFDLFPGTGPVDFSRDLFPRLLELGLPLYGKTLSGFWRDIGRPSDLIFGNINMFPRNRGTNIYVSSGVLEGVKLRGKCYLGERVEVGTGVELNDVYIYEDCNVGRNTIINNAVICPGVHLGENAFINDSYLCPGVSVGDDVTIKKSVIGEGVKVSSGEMIIGKRISTGPKSKGL